MQNNTPPKEIPEELPKAFEPKNVEAKWYSHWVESGFFRANPNSSKPPYCIVMPPPNAQGCSIWATPLSILCRIF